MPVLREGNVIMLANTTLEVAEACSGIRSLDLAADPGDRLRLFHGLSHLGAGRDRRVDGADCDCRQRPPRGRHRVLAHYYGPEAALGFFHTFSGWLVFLAAFAMLFVVVSGLRRLAPETAHPSTRRR